MTSTLQYVARGNGAPLFYAGWAGFAIFGVLVFIDGNADLSYAVFHALVAGAICTWYAMTAGKAAPIAGAVLGALYALQMAFFLLSGLTSNDIAMKTTAEDAFGLLAAGLILSGAFLSLGNAALRRPDPHTF